MTPLTATNNLAAPTVEADARKSATTLMLGAHSTWATAYERLDGLLDLELNWDGYSAKPVDRVAWRIAKDLLSALHTSNFPEPDVFPVPDGGVQLEWTRGLAELELEIDPTGSMIFVYDDPRVPEGIDGQLPQDQARFVAVLQRLFDH